MSNFYALLKQSIIDRGISDAEDRENIYAQARDAVLRKLESHDPPLGEEEIETRVEAFDVAVTEIETDLLGVFSTESAPLAATEDVDAEPAADEIPEEDPIARSRVLAITRYRQALQSSGVVNAAYDPEPADDEEATAGEHPGTETDDDRAYWRSNPPALAQDDEYYDVDRDAYAEEDVYGEDGADHYTDDDGCRDNDTVYHDDDRYDSTADYDPPAHDADDAYAYSDEEEDFEPAVPPAPRRDRWTGRGEPDAPSDKRAKRNSKPKKPAKHGLSERNQVRILIGAISFLVIAIIGFFVYMLMPSNTGQGNDPIGDVIASSDGVRREVSDAATASRIPAEDLDVVQSFVVFDGLDPTVFDASPGNPVLFDRDDDGGFARVSSGTASTGVRVLIGPGLAERLAGQRIRVVLVARASREEGAASMRFAYQSGLAISHWQTANLSSDYVPLGLLWRVPRLRTDDNGDLLLIEPGIPGDGTAMDIQSIRIDLLAPDGS